MMISAPIYSGDVRQITVGRLQSWFLANGAEPEVGRRHLVSDQQDGLRWPAQYKYQDTEVAKALWIGTKNYTDAPQYGGNTYEYKVVHVGPRVSGENEFFPVKFKLIGKFEAPRVYVEGFEASSLKYLDMPDEIDPNLNCDRKIVNVVNTSIGITVKRNILAWTNQNHDNYFIYEYTFTNTGNIDADEDIEQSVTLKDVWFFFQYRYAPTREACAYGYYWLPQSTTWGASTMLDVRGEDPGSGDPFRAMFSWLGKHSQWTGPGDNIGGPNFLGDGRLGAAQYVGVVTLHADHSPQDGSDDPYQPKTTQYVDSDAPYTSNNSQFDASKMADEYQLMSAGHSARMADLVGDGYADQFGSTFGGYSHGQGFGPYTLAPGESVHIILAEGVAGLNRKQCYEIGGNWLHGSAPFQLPDGSTTNDANQYKNAWVFTGQDSLFKTFQHAIENYQSGYSISSPPPPPNTFELFGSRDHIKLYWSDNAESWPNFGGYIIYRTVGRNDTIYHPIFSCGLHTDNPQIVHYYEDHDVQPDKDYYYYIVSFDDGSKSNGIPLKSSLFWTRTAQAAKLDTIDRVDADLYVSPNGDDANSGLTESEPLKTIHYALSKIITGAYHQHKIYLSSGVYSPSSTGEKFPLHIDHSFLQIIGQGKQQTIIDAEHQQTALYINGDSVRLSGLTIRNAQQTDYANGSGIYAFWAKDLILTDIRIQNNSARNGGGIYATHSQITFNNISIHDNVALYNGGGIYFDATSKLNFDEVHLNSVYGNTSLIGNDLYGIGEISEQSFTFDTLTVLKPSDYYVFPIGRISVTAQNYMVAQKDADLYVSPEGDDQNDGLSPASPLKTITTAIKQIQCDAQNPHTIHLAAGIYSDSASQELFPLYANEGLIIKGVSNKATILDGGLKNSIFYFNGKQNLSIENVAIQKGKGSTGAGIIVEKSNVKLKNVLIEKNQANKGAGIFCTDSATIQLTNVTIRQNNGGGIYWQYHSTALFDSSNRCNIYFNTAMGDGQDLKNVGDALIHVVLDTFTVKYPLEKYAYPLTHFTFDILNGKIKQLEADLYVSPTGNDENDGLSDQTPFKTIQKAMDLIFADQSRPHKIILAEGTYSTSATGENFPINIKEYVTLTGQSQENTILDGENQYQLFHLINTQHVKIENMTIRNGNGDYGGALYAENESFEMKQLTFTNNQGKYGGAIYLDGSDGNLENVVIQNNTSSYYGGAFYLKNSQIKLNRALIVNNYSEKRSGVFTINQGAANFVHCTIVGNSTVYDKYGITYGIYPADIIMVNSIVWSNGSQKPILGRSSMTLTMFHNDIQGGYDGLNAGVSGTLNWLDGNFDQDPKFVGGQPFDYNLTQQSPCVDAGATFFVWDGDTVLNVSDDEFQGNAPDLGALESIYTGIDGNSFTTIPNQVTLYPNYPNPFNPSTTIKYALPKKMEVRLIVFDVLGRKVATLVNKVQTAGYKVVKWEGQNDMGRRVASGVYLISLSTPQKKLVQKVILMK